MLIDTTDEILGESFFPHSPYFLVYEDFTAFFWFVQMQKDFGSLNSKMFSDTKDYTVKMITPDAHSSWFIENVSPFITDLECESSGPFDLVKISETQSFFHRRLPRYIIQYQPDFVNYLNKYF